MQNQDHRTNTVHVERIEPDDSSASGMQTRNLSLSSSGTMLPAAQPRNRNNTAAMTLIAVGVFIALGRLLPSADELVAGLILLTISSGFLFFSFSRRIYGLLIPGSILAGLGLGVPLADLTNGVSVLWGLALGFVGIMVLGRALFNKHRSWPLYPAVPLFLVGVITAIASLPSFLAGGMLWFPLLLIGAGLYLGWGRRTA